MKASTLVFVAALGLSAPVFAQTPAAPAQTAEKGEPLPANAPQDSYELAAWCFGALNEYLDIYDRVKPDLRAIDKMWGTSEKGEVEPYHDEILADRKELKMISGAVEAAEKASSTPISARGVEAIKAGRMVWAPVEQKTSRELARAWLSWGLPDRCDTNARSLASNAAVLGQALKYNAGDQPATSPPPSANPQ